MGSRVSVKLWVAVSPLAFVALASSFRTDSPRKRQALLPDTPICPTLVDHARSQCHSEGTAPPRIPLARLRAMRLPHSFDTRPPSRRILPRLSHTSRLSQREHLPLLAQLRTQCT